MAVGGVLLHLNAASRHLIVLSFVITGITFAGTEV